MSQTRKAGSKDGTVIAYDRIGQGPAVILVDGALGHRGHMGGRPLSVALASDYTVVAYDRRGRGESASTRPYAVDREIEDIDALIQALGTPVFLYGFSSGAVLALIAASRLGDKVAKLAVLEPPFGPGDAQARQESLEQARQMSALIEAGKNDEAVTFFLQDMVPPDALAAMKESPEWQLMKAVAPTLAHDHAIMGDGAVPGDIARAVRAPVLVLDGGDSPDFKHTAADELAAALPNARRQTLPGQSTLVPPETLAPVLASFFRGSSAQR